MRKKIVFLVSWLCIVICMTSCGQEEAAEEKAESQNSDKFSYSSDETGAKAEKFTYHEEPVADPKYQKEQEVPWKELYKSQINAYEKKYGDKVLGYWLLYMDDNEIPELCACAEDTVFVGVDFYTIVDGNLEYVQRYDMEGKLDQGNGEFTSYGRQGQEDCYIERTGYYFLSGAMGGSWYTLAYKLSGSHLNQILSYHEHMDWDGENEKYTTTWRYQKNDGTLAEERKDIAEELDERPDIEQELGISFAPRKEIIDRELMMDASELLEYLSK